MSLVVHIPREFHPDALENPLVAPYLLFDVGDCPYHYRIQMVAPEGSPYEGHNLEVSIFFPPHHPMNPPKVALKFEGDLFHLNIIEADAIRLDFLHENWTPAIRVVVILVCILGFLLVLNPDDPHPDCEGVALIY